MFSQSTFSNSISFIPMLDQRDLAVSFFFDKFNLKKLQYEKDVKEIIETSIIPSLEDISVLDLLLYIDLYFNNEQEKRKNKKNSFTFY